MQKPSRLDNCWLRLRRTFFSLNMRELMRTQRGVNMSSPNKSRNGTLDFPNSYVVTKARNYQPHNMFVFPFSIFLSDQANRKWQYAVLFVRWPVYFGTPCQPSQIEPSRRQPGSTRPPEACSVVRAMLCIIEAQALPQINKFSFGAKRSSKIQKNLWQLWWAPLWRPEHTRACSLLETLPSHPNEDQPETTK